LLIPGRDRVQVSVLGQLELALELAEAALSAAAARILRSGFRAGVLIGPGRPAALAAQCQLALLLVDADL
jgi:hypothetical protein